MNLNWLNSLIYGVLSGLANVLPVSMKAHQALFLKFLGIQEEMELMNLLVNLAVLLALYHSTQSQLLRMNRARAQARIPKRKRKRPLDVYSLMDWSLLKTMAIPVILGLLAYRYIQHWTVSLMMLSIFLFVNGLILYIPQFLPTSNRDSRTLSRVEGLLMGLGGAAAIIPGVSGVGAIVSVGSVCGVERKYALDLALLMNMLLMAGMVVYDVMNLYQMGLGTVSFLILVRYLLTAAAAYAGTAVAIRIMRYFAENRGYALMGVYCWGISLFIFILNLVA